MSGGKTPSQLLDELSRLLTHANIQHRHYRGCFESIVIPAEAGRLIEIMIGWQRGKLNAPHCFMMSHIKMERGRPVARHDIDLGYSAGSSVQPVVDAAWMLRLVQNAMQPLSNPWLYLQPRYDRYMMLLGRPSL